MTDFCDENIDVATVKKDLAEEFGSCDDFRDMNREKRQCGQFSGQSLYEDNFTRFLDKSKVSVKSHPELYAALEKFSGEFAKLIMTPAVYKVH